MYRCGKFSNKLKQTNTQAPQTRKQVAETKIKLNVSPKCFPSPLCLHVTFVIASLEPVPGSPSRKWKIKRTQAKIKRARKRERLTPSQVPRYFAFVNSPFLYPLDPGTGYICYESKISTRLLSWQ